MSVCGVYVWYVISHFFGCVLEEFDFFFAAYCHAMVLSFFCRFIGSRFLCQPLICACNWIFQVSREQEKCLKKYFLLKFSMNFVLSLKSHCSLYLLCLGIICLLDLCAMESILNLLIFVFLCALYIWCFIFLFFCCLWKMFHFILTAFGMGCCFHFLVFSSNMGFIGHRLYAYERIFQVSEEREKCRRKFFIDKFTSYSLFFFIFHCSIYLICLGIIFSLHLCGIEVIFIVLISLFSCALRVWFFFIFNFFSDFICCLL